MGTHSCTTSNIHSYMNKDMNIRTYKCKDALHMQVITHT